MKELLSTDMFSTDYALVRHGRKWHRKPKKKAAAFGMALTLRLMCGYDELNMLHRQ